MNSFSPLFRRSVLVAVLMALASFSTASETVRLAADEWMPYNGSPDTQRPGYVVEFAQEIFKPRGIEVEYSVVSWEEALEDARVGDVDGAIGANVEEGAGLVLGQESIGAPKMIMLTRRDATWNYENIRSLSGIRLGVIAEYSYWEALDKYIVRSTDASVYVSRAESPLDELFTMLQEGKIDALIDSEAVVVWKLREMGKTREDFRAVYRHMPDPIFIAFSPTDKGRRLAEIFDEGMKALVASGRADEIAASYGLRDWR